MTEVVDPASWAHKRSKYDDPRVAAEYEERRYGTWSRRWRQSLHEGTLARALADLPAGSLVLDLPCGTGHLAPWLRSRGLRVVGADIAPAMLRVAREKRPPGGPLLGFVGADAERLPFADRSIDVALMVRFLHLMPLEVRHRVYRELARVVRHRVVFSVSCDPWAAKHIMKRLTSGSRPYFMTKSEMRDDLAAHGLTLEAIHQKLPFISTSWVVVCRPS